MDAEEALKAVQAAHKALHDTKAYATKLAQELAAKNAEIEVFETVGVKVPKEIDALKESDPEKYATELEKYKQKLEQERQKKADEAKAQALKQMLNDAAQNAGLKDDLTKLVPPVVIEQYESGKIDATRVVELAQQYEKAAKSVTSPTTTEEFDLTTVAGADFVPSQKREADETLNPRDYIL